MAILRPHPDRGERAALAEHIRSEATGVSRERAGRVTIQVNNGEVDALRPPIASFTKSLVHDEYGFPNRKGFDDLLHELNQDGAVSKGSVSDTTTFFPGTWATMRRADYRVDLCTGEPLQAMDGEIGPRTHESPLAGHTYQLAGADADTLAMPPAPQLGSAELTFEMAELYAMALLRDVPFQAIEDGSGVAKVPSGGLTVADAVATLAALPWIQSSTGARTVRERKRHEARFVKGKFDKTALFRGSTEGAREGPYVSQFLLVGNAQRGLNQPVGVDALAAQWSLTVSPNFAPALSNTAAGGIRRSDGPDGGRIQYGQQVIDQQLVPHCFMEGWAEWLDVQNGLDTRTRARFLTSNDKLVARFIATPRDLATYVHYDALYQAYLNACLWLLGQEAEFDAGLPEGTGHPTRGAFATFGGPHIQTLVTEVATRALKAVRRQKYLIHLRGRPEAIGGAMTLQTVATQVSAPDWPEATATLTKVAPIAAALKGTPIAAALKARTARNLKKDRPPAGYEFLDAAENWLLPMAFPEGSPVHPSYGAGHATVAGACVTILKASFEMYALPEKVTPGDLFRASRCGEDAKKKLAVATVLDGKGKGLSVYEMIEGAADLKTLKPLSLKMTGTCDKRLQALYRAAADGSSLEPIGNDLSLAGELDKLAANIAIARNMAGVNYYTDYNESLRMGERVAVGLLQEQALTYREPFSMRFPSFDGDWIMMVANGGSYRRGERPGEEDDALVLVWPADRDPAWLGRKPGTADFDRAVAQEYRAWWHRATDQAAAPAP